MKEKRNENTKRWAARLGLILVDALSVNVAYYCALIIRLREGHGFQAGSEVFFDTFYRFMPWYTLFCIGVFALFKLYDGMWRYAGLSDFARVLTANLITCLFHFSTIFLIHIMPLIYYALGAVFQLILVCLTRFSYRLISVEVARFRKARSSATVNVMIVGAGENGRRLIRYLEDDLVYRPVCVLDSKSENYGVKLDGVPLVGGMENADKAVASYGVKAVFIADPLLQPALREELKKVCLTYGIDLVNYGPQFYESENLAEKPHRPKKSDGERQIIPFSPPDISEREIGEVVEALRSGWITTGPRTKLLERRLAAFIETGRADVDTEAEPERWGNRVVCLNSATAAEELNFRILGIREGDEVLVPAYTYTASASAAIHCGATVKFIDIQKDGDPASHMPEMDYDRLEAAIGPKTKAVVTVDLGGIVCDYERVFEIVEKKHALFTPLASDGTPLGDLSARIQSALGRVAVVADSAHALGASRVFRGEKTYCGAIADFTDFSFHAVKNFTTAEGGASTWRPLAGIDNAEIYHFYQLLSLHGQSKDALAKTKVGAWEYDIVGPWYKCNMTDIMAAIGLRQLDRYPGLLERRVEIIKKYSAVCDELGISHLVHHVGGMDSSNHLYLIRLPGFTDLERSTFIEKLAERGVSANVHYKPLPMMTAYRALGWDIADFPNTYDYYHNLVTLPLHTLLSDEDVDYVCASLRAVYKEMRA